jgi:hypothetical protein
MISSDIFSINKRTDTENDQLVIVTDTENDQLVIVTDTENDQLVIVMILKTISWSL